MAQVTAFGKQVKKRLVDLDQDQGWLIEEVRKKTGLFFDGGYLWKVLAGVRNAPKVTNAIAEILKIEPPEEMGVHTDDPTDDA